MQSENACVGFDTDWLHSYRATNSNRLSDDPDFAAWLESEYVPIAGGWQY